MDHFVFGADCHMSPRIWENVPEVRGDAYDSFRQIVDYTLRTGASSLVLGGDIFDRTPTSECMKLWLDMMDQLHKGHVKCYAIQGQHGRTSNGYPWHAVTPLCQDVNGLSFQVTPNLSAYALERMGAKELEERLKSLHPVNDLENVPILFLHQLTRGSVPEVGGMQIWDFDPSWTPGNFKLILMGDLHEPWEASREAWLRSTIQRFIYNGSMVLRSISEPDEKSFLDISDDLVVKRIPLKTRAFRRLSVFSDAQLTAAVDNVADLPAGSVVYLRYDPRVENTAQMMQEVCSNRDLVLLLKTVITEQVAAGVVEMAEQTSLEGCLSLAVDRQGDPELFDFAKELLRSSLPVETIEKYRKTMTGAKG